MTQIENQYSKAVELAQDGKKLDQMAIDFCTALIAFVGIELAKSHKPLANTGFQVDYKRPSHPTFTVHGVSLRMRADHIFMKQPDGTVALHGRISFEKDTVGMEEGEALYALAFAADGQTAVRDHVGQRPEFTHNIAGDPMDVAETCRAVVIELIGEVQSSLARK